MDENERYLMIYKCNIREEIKILGKDFVKNNKNKGKLIINNKKTKLKEFMQIEKNIKTSKNKEKLTIPKENLKIYMLLNKEVSNASYMFDDCVLLTQFSYYYKEESDYYNQFCEYEDYENLIDYNIELENNNEHPLYMNLKDSQNNNFSKKRK